MIIPTVFWLVPIASIVALGMAFFFFRQMMAEDEGTPRMCEIALYDDSLPNGSYCLSKRSACLGQGQSFLAGSLQLGTEGHFAKERITFFLAEGF